MKLLKVRNGLREVENFFLTSSFCDFAKQSNVTRNIKTNQVNIKSNNSIERNFNYKEFVLDIKKEKTKQTLKLDDYLYLYFKTKDNALFGLREVYDKKQYEYWRIIKQENYIQAYQSDDNVNWENVGGMKLDEDIEAQGFKKFCNEDFILDEYKVYENSYLTIFNLQGDLCELYDKDNNLIATRKIIDNEVKFVLDNEINCYIVTKTIDDLITFKSENFKAKFGDQFVLSKYNIDVFYKDNIITNRTTKLEEYETIIQLKNNDNTDIDLNLSIDNKTIDTILLSQNGIDYKEKIRITLQASSKKNIFIKAIRNKDNINFRLHNFSLNIE